MSQVGFSGVCNFTPTSIVNAVRVAAYGTVGGAGESCAPRSSGPVAALDLNFLTMTTLDPRITFTRASSATYFNSSGILTTVATNEPRFGYDPVTLAPMGFLMEQSRTNVLLNSDAPVSQSLTVAGTTYTLSFYGTGTITLSGAATGVVVGVGAFPARTIYTFVATAGTLTLTITGTVSYAQLENAAYASSYIPTTSVQVTRASEIAVMTGTNFSSWYNQTQGTFYSEFSSGNSIGEQGITGYQFTVSDATAANQIYFTSSSSVSTRMQVSYLSVVQANVIVSTVNQLSVNKQAGAYATNDVRSVINNGSIVADTAATIPTVSKMNICGSYLGGGTLNGFMRRLKFYNTPFADSELQALTT